MTEKAMMKIIIIEKGKAKGKSEQKVIPGLGRVLLDPGANGGVPAGSERAALWVDAYRLGGITYYAASMYAEKEVNNE